MSNQLVSLTKKPSQLKGISGHAGKGKGIALPNSCGNNNSSEEDDPSFSEDLNGGNSSGAKGSKGFPWQRMKWTDEVVRLLIAVVAYVGDDGMHECMDGLKRKIGMLQKKGKWKLVSKIMVNRGCLVSPQQCEDKFNDLNKRYKKLNDILGRGTSCKVVEDPSLMDAMPHLTEKMKEEVRKILNSKHLFYREMCAYHNGQRIPNSNDIDLQAQSLSLARRSNDDHGSQEEEAEQNDESEDDELNNDDDNNLEGDKVMMEVCYGTKDVHGESSNIGSWSGVQDSFSLELGAVLQDRMKSPEEQRELIQHCILRLKEQRVMLHAEALEFKKQHFRWLRFRGKKDRELERLRLENESMRLVNDRMVLQLKQTGIELMN
ncbi:hypothetical protein Ancab_000103 [Ancistrocladus abbreviatus]